MPTETLLVLALVGFIFAAFSAGVAYADLRTREFRE